MLTKQIEQTALNNSRPEYYFLYNCFINFKKSVLSLSENLIKRRGKVSIVLLVHYIEGIFILVSSQGCLSSNGKWEIKKEQWWPSLSGFALFSFILKHQLFVETYEQYADVRSQAHFLAPLHLYRAGLQHGF